MSPKQLQAVDRHDRERDRAAGFREFGVCDDTFGTFAATLLASDRRALVENREQAYLRAQKASGDHTGQYARQWLAGRPIGKPANLIEQDVYELLSGPAHANERAVREWLALAQQDGLTGVVDGPERRPRVG